MSVSKWAYEPWKCDHDYCIGECDMCGKAEMSYCDENECTHDGIRCSECPVLIESEHEE